MPWDTAVYIFYDQVAHMSTPKFFWGTYNFKIISGRKYRVALVASTNQSFYFELYNICIQRDTNITESSRYNKLIY